MAASKRQKKSGGSEAKARLHFREQRQDDGHFGETVGADLRMARKEQGLDIDGVAAKLRLKPENIRAIEESDFDALPGKTYAIGFVRAYAQLMSVETEEYIRRFKAEMTDAEELKFNSITRRAPGKRIPVGLLITGAVTLVLAWNVWRMADEATGAGEDVIVAFQPKLPSPVSRTNEDASSDMDGTNDSTSVSVAARAAQSDIPDGTAWGSENHDARIRMKALSDVWLRVEAEGYVMFERILGAGDSYAPPNSADIRIVTRNAGELEIWVDGSYIRRLGEEGSALAVTKLDPDGLLAGARLEGR